MFYKSVATCIFLLGISLNFSSANTHEHSLTSAQTATLRTSVQLHSVRDAVIEDFKATLTQIATLGFDAVEFAGRYGPYKNDPKGLRNFLDSLGLEVSGAHISLSQLTSEQADEHIAFLKAIGANTLIIPHDKRIDDPNKIGELVKELRAVSKALNKEQMKLGYHNHAKEFVLMSGSSNTSLSAPLNKNTFWDYLAQNTPQKFVLQLDVGWANYAGVDAIDFIKRYPQRTQTTHIKIRTYQGKPGTITSGLPVIVGDDNYDWQTLINVLQTHGGTKWLVIEQEEYPQGMTPLETVAASKRGLDRILSLVNKT